MRWDHLKNGDLLAEAPKQFDVVPVDRNIWCRQNPPNRGRTTRGRFPASAAVLPYNGTAGRPVGTGGGSSS